MGDVITLILSIGLGLLILTFLVVIHELGHAIVARRNGVVVEEFGIGFPPRAWSKKLKNSLMGKNVLLTLNWLPLGGFVKLQGEHDADSGKGDYGAATFWQKTKILLAGVAINWLAAAILLSGLALYGIPKILPDQFSLASDTTLIGEPPQVLSVGENSPASAAGLEAGDVITRFNSTEISSSSDLIEATKNSAGQEAEITYTRDDQEARATVTLRDQEQGEREGYLGAGLGERELVRATWSAPIVGFGLTGQLTWLTLQGLGETLSNFVIGLAQQLSFNDETRQESSQRLESAGQNVAGPVGLLGAILPRLIEAGPAHVIFIAAIISLSLAVLNALPIPALDGGRWFLTAVYRVIRRPLTAEREEIVNGIGFLMLMGLFVLITIADIGKF